MARFYAAKAAEEYAIKLSQLAYADQREIAGEAIYEAAKIVADEAKRRLQGVIKGPSTGALVASLGIAKLQETADGYNVKIGFRGYDHKGVAEKVAAGTATKFDLVKGGTPNLLKARVMESGSSKQKKRPFMRPAVQATKDAAVKKMGEVIDEEIARIMNN